MDTTNMTPLQLATDVAFALTELDEAHTWTARSRDYRVDQCAEIVNEHGDTVWMEIMDRGYARANERGKVRFRESYGRDLSDHLPYGHERAETMISASRGPAAMAKDVLRKIVERVVATGAQARESRAQWLHEAEQVHATALRFADLVDDDHGRRQLEQIGPQATVRYTVGSRYGGIYATAEVHADEVHLTLRELPVEMAERFLREVRAYRFGEEVPDDGTGMPQSAALNYFRAQRRAEAAQDDRDAEPATDA